MRLLWRGARAHPVVRGAGPAGSSPTPCSQKLLWAAGASAFGGRGRQELATGRWKSLSLAKGCADGKSAPFGRQSLWVGGGEGAPRDERGLWIGVWSLRWLRMAREAARHMACQHQACLPLLRAHANLGSARRSSGLPASGRCHYLKPGPRVSGADGLSGHRLRLSSTEATPLWL